MAETIVDNIVTQSIVNFVAYFNAQNHTYKGSTYTIEASYPNKGYEPQQGQPYIAYYIIPANTSQRTLGNEAPNTQLGFVQLDIYIPGGNGTGQLDDIVTDLKPYFRRGTFASLASEPNTKVEYLTFSPDREEKAGVYYRKIISVNYRCVLPNY